MPPPVKQSVRDLISYEQEKILRVRAQETIVGNSAPASKQVPSFKNLSINGKITQV